MNLQVCAIVRSCAKVDTRTPIQSAAASLTSSRLFASFADDLNWFSEWVRLCVLARGLHARLWYGIKSGCIRHERRGRVSRQRIQSGSELVIAVQHLLIRDHAPRVRGHPAHRGDEARLD